MCSSLWKTIFRTSSFPWLSVVLWLGLRTHGPSPLYFSVSIVVSVQFMFRQSLWCDFVNVVSDNTERDNLMANFLILWLLTAFLSCLYDDPQALGVAVKNVIQNNYFNFWIPSGCCYLYQKKRVICQLMLKK